MCGIAGFCDFNRKSDFHVLKQMTDSLTHRGPDDHGYSFYDTEFANIGLGHRRLSILDLSHLGHQPMKFDNFEIVYNGEVYNYKEIRSQLEKLGYKFNSNTDTEVILKAFHKWGIDCVNKFNGMFAICVYNHKNQTLTLIRDRCGIKPLYYYFKNGLFIFGSELKVFYQNPYFRKKLSSKGLELFLRSGYIIQPYSIFENLYKLESGCYAVLNIKNIKFECFKYWNIENFYDKEKLCISESEAVTHISELLKDSLKYRLISDVPVGVFLSGGFDSSTITAFLTKHLNVKVDTFTIGFKNEKYNEAPFAKEIANELCTNHSEIYIDNKDLTDIVPNLSEVYDEPFGDTSSIPTILVCKMAKRNVGVVLSADGGDELFAGYSKYDNVINEYEKILKVLKYKKLTMFLPNHFLKFGKDNSMIRKLAKFKELMENDVNFNKFWGLKNSVFSTYMLNSLVKYNDFLSFKYEDTEFDSKFDTMLMLDFKHYMQEDILLKVDRASMSVSLESREPFLDYKLVEFVAQLPDFYKINFGEKKYLLKQIAYKNIRKDLLDRPKMGFSAPIGQWLNGELYWLVEEFLSENFIKKQDIFNYAIIRYLVNELKNKNFSVASKIWFLIIFQMWFKKWMN